MDKPMARPPDFSHHWGLEHKSGFLRLSITDI